jgi:hypothetical protein
MRLAPNRTSARRRACGALAFATVFAAGLVAAPAQEACSIQPVRLCDGCTVIRMIKVRKDSGCTFRQQVNESILGIDVKVAPRHGIFGKSNPTLQAYVPRKGYVGADYFEYVFRFEQFGKPASTTIQNRVEVVEGSVF